MKPHLAAMFCAVLVAAGAVGQTPVTQPPTTSPTTRPALPPPQDQSLDRLLSSPSSAAEPLKPVDLPPVLDQTTGKMVYPTTSATAPLHREGEYIHGRIARLTRSPDGQGWELTFDADGRGLQDPPMGILPSLQLMKMEAAVNATNRDLRFRISGTVTEYKGRNYILLETVTVPPDSTQAF
jgi:hypothetical protein